MKKKLEAELISIAHRILKLKNKSELIQLHSEAQKVYEKLSVLLFVEENFAGVKPTIGMTEAYEVLETAFDGDDSEELQPKASENEKAPEKDSDKKEEKIEDPKPEPEIAPEKIEEPKETPEPEKKVEETETVAETESESEEEPKGESDEEIAPEEKEAAETEIQSEEAQPQAEAEVSSEEKSDDKSEEEEAKSEEEKPKVVVDENSVVEEGINFNVPETNAEIAQLTGVPEEKAEDLFKPAFEWTFEAKTEEPKEDKDSKSGQIAFDDLLGTGYVDPVFVKPEENTPKAPESVFQTIPSGNIFENKIPDVRRENTEIADKSVSLNDRISKGITVGLNDRIAFVKNLFGNSTEEYNRVLSQLITFNTFEEAQEFIDSMVKPDYNNWEGKDEYAQRFMEVVEKKFV